MDMSYFNANIMTYSLYEQAFEGKGIILFTYEELLALVGVFQK